MELPASYSSLPFTQIRVHHHPSSSPSPTPILVLELYRPKHANAFTEHMAQEIVDVYSLFDADDRVKAVVVTGHGKVFCAGADLNMGFQREVVNKRPSEHRDGGGRIALAIHKCSKPTIGALNGSAVGVGLTMTFPMAIRVASRAAKFGVVFARRGIVTDACSSFFLPRLVGHAKAIHLVTTGAVYPATSHLLADLWGELVEPADVLPRALAIAEDVTKNTSAVSGKLCRDLMWRGPQTAEEAHLLESKLLFESFASKDHQEGLRSFLEKRDADFKGQMSKDKPENWPWYSVADVGEANWVTEKRGSKL